MRGERKQMAEKIKYYDELNNLQKLPNDQFINKDTYVNDALKLSQ